MATELSPPPGTIYADSKLTLAGMISGAGVTGIEWRRNGTVIANNRNGFVLTQRFAAESQMLTVSLESNFTASSHSGSYQLLVNAATGTGVVGEWSVREAGKEGRG
jgi:hypothetical protein